MRKVFPKVPLAMSPDFFTGPWGRVLRQRAATV